MNNEPTMNDQYGYELTCRSVIHGRLELVDHCLTAKKYERWFSEAMDRPEVAASELQSATAVIYFADTQLAQFKWTEACYALFKAEKILMQQPPSLRVLQLLMHAASMLSSIDEGKHWRRILRYVESCLKMSNDNELIKLLAEVQTMRWEFENQKCQRDQLFLEIRELTKL